jgi:hypothetical protein
MKANAMTPQPKPGDILAVYKYRFEFSSEEVRIGLSTVDRVTPTGQLVLRHPFGARKHDAGGSEIGAIGAQARLHVRWPTDIDRADHRRKKLIEALHNVTWSVWSDETREAVAKLLNIEVREP